MVAKYKSLEALVDKIQKRNKQLLDGKLDEKGLNNFIETVQELQERLVIMRFKAYEDALSKPVDENPKSNGLQFDLRNQISLIDAIEEEVKKDAPATTPGISLDVKPTASESKTEKEIPVKKQEIAPKKEVEQLASKSESEPTKVHPTPKPAKEVVPDPMEEKSLNERLSAQANATSLNEKLKKTPIDDLPKAIGINQKYLFINELFNQNADHFNQVVSELNNCNSYKEALTKVRGELVPNYKWDDEDKNVMAFMDLVERRYLN